MIYMTLRTPFLSTTGDYTSWNWNSEDWKMNEMNLAPLTKKLKLYILNIMI